MYSNEIKRFAYTYKYAKGKKMCSKLIFTYANTFKNPQIANAFFFSLFKLPWLFICATHNVINMII